ncbi:hypothetical protein COLO4_37884 [Corchorus olitorius]|uniref:Uncharacterized protein n=1 Tax=Corchorus olitorius TaxID=93759 RepID=A0A1R3FY71_9ROSI|nr:hypothetical protein COLO4_37884 [Corchorus olitorius]
MGILPCHLSCHRDDESQSGSSHLHSESSTSSISSQPSLPSVPSLTSSSRRLEQTPTIHQKCIATLKGNSYVFSIALSGKILYSGSSNGEIRAWSQDSSDQDTPVDNTVATSNSAVKSLVVLGDKLFSAHQDNKIRIWKINNNHLQQKYKCIATLPTMNDRFLRCFSEKNYVQVQQTRKLSGSLDYDIKVWQLWTPVFFSNSYGFVQK